MRPSKSAQARALAADGVEPAEIQRRLGITRQAVASALRNVPTGERRGPKSNTVRCDHCGGTGRVAKSAPSYVVVAGVSYPLGSDLRDPGLVAASQYCEHECAGNRLPPLAGHLWPSEWRDHITPPEAGSGAQSESDVSR